MQIRPTSNVQRSSAINIQPQSNRVSADSTSMPVDQLNISAEAQMMSVAATGTEVRADRVADIRAQIATGKYETAEKLDVAVGRLLNEIA